MRLYIKRPKNGVDAVAEFDSAAKSITVLKGSRVSEFVSHASTFRGANSIEKSRATYVENGIVVEEAMFTSASTAANFVVGSSINGLIAWKDENGITLKELLARQQV